MTKNFQTAPRPTRDPLIGNPTLKFLKQLWDFIGSMRFAVSMLTVVAIASAIGTLLKQNEPHINYTNQFGDFYNSNAVVSREKIYRVAIFFTVVGVLFSARSHHDCFIYDGTSNAQQPDAWRIFSVGMDIVCLGVLCDCAAGL